MNELRESRAGKIAEARGLVDGAEKAGRDLSAEEQERYQGLVKEIDELGQRIQRGEQVALLEASLSQSAGRATVGMSAGEVRRYSLVRAIRAAAAGDWRGAELEREASEAVARQVGRQPQGFFVPGEWQEKRDLTVGTPSAGGYTVSTDLAAGSFIEMLRNKLMVRAAGATILSNLTGDLAIPKQTGGATAYWLAESGSPSESAPAFGQVLLQPKTVGAYSDISRKLLKQSSIDVENFVRNDLSMTLALAIDAKALHGSGSSNEPTGIASTIGIGSVAGGTNGLAPTWAHLVALETEVATDNADVGRLAYMTNAKVRGKLKGTPRTATYGDIMIWEPTAGNTPVNGYPVHVTNQVSSTLTKGSSSGVCSAIFFGNWADLVVGMWGVLDLLVDPYTGSTAGTVRVVALQDVDIAVRNAQSFAAMLDALTS